MVVAPGLKEAVLSGVSGGEIQILGVIGIFVGMLNAAAPLLGSLLWIYVLDGGLWRILCLAAVLVARDIADGSSASVVSFTKFFCEG